MEGVVDVASWRLSDLRPQGDNERLSCLERAEAGQAVVHTPDDSLDILSLLVDADDVLLEGEEGLRWEMWGEGREGEGGG